jgi:hypothetical protein
MLSQLPLHVLSFEFYRMITLTIVFLSFFYPLQMLFSCFCFAPSYLHVIAFGIISRQD